MPELGQNLDAVLAAARCVVCVGPGGVGKTSTSAAIAMEAARQGRRTIVLTIDPARRLANALGLPEIGNEEREVDAAAFRAAGLEPPKGRMTAMMLDIKEAWDRVIERYHPDPERRKKLLGNRLYVAMSTALAGSQEYMAMEKLFELSQREEDPLDLIVLDTPPAAHAVDFLEAPSRMIDALDNDATRWLLEPYQQKKRITKKLFDAGSSFFIRTISRFTGVELLQELAEMLAGFQGMFDGFRDRAVAVRKLLGADDTTFLVISTPDGPAVESALRFYERLVEREIHVGGVVLNRATVDPFAGGEAPDPGPFRDTLAALGGGPDLAARIEAVALEAQRDAGAQRASALVLAGSVGARPVILLPQLSRDVHDLEGLESLRRGLFSA